MRSEPSLDVVGIAGHPYSGDADLAGGMGGASPAGEPCSWRPLDEERQRGLGGGLFDACQSPSHELSISGGSRPCLDGQAQSRSDFAEIVRPNCPAERTEQLALRSGYPSPEGTVSGNRCVNGRDQLEIRVTEGHDAIGRPPARVSATPLGPQPVFIFDRSGCCREISHGDHDVVKLSGVPRRGHGR